MSPNWILMIISEGQSIFSLLFRSLLSVDSINLFSGSWILSSVISIVLEPIQQDVYISYYSF